MTEDERRIVPQPGRSASLASLCDAYWQAVLEEHPMWATFLGVHAHDDRVDDLSVEGDERRRAHLRGTLAALTRLEPDLMSRDDLVTAALLRHRLDVAVSSIDMRLVELGSDHMKGPHTSLLMITPQLGYPEPDHARAALTRYAQVPILLGQALDRFRAGAAVGRSPASASVNRTLSMLDGYLNGRIDDDPFLSVTLPDSWEGGDSWRSEARELVSERIRPAFALYRDALAGELGPIARDDRHPGWCWLADGEQMYAATIREHTTLDRSPRELHDLGRQLCEEILPERFATLGAEVFATSDVSTVFDRLRNDPELRHSDAEEILATARSSVGRAEASMGDWFGRLPTAACRVEPIPAFLAADAPYAYYFPPAPDGSRAGTYFINTADPQGSSRTEAESIAFHEAIPGHHLQIAISQELTGLPEFQRHDGSTAYVEGWGLYAERLAEEMGLYSSGLDCLGMLTADAWRCARLVVDTGLHALGWSRNQAIDYFVDNTPVPVDQIAAEVDRYIAMPGQALAYKVGQLEFERLRTEAHAALGTAFSVADFHDIVLGSGAVTLPVLARMVGQWVESITEAGS